MSKRSSLSASSRLRSKKESSPAPRRPTKKKSLSSSRSTAAYQNRKVTGQLKTALEELGHLRRQAPAAKSMFQVIEQLMLATGNPRKLALLIQVAGHLMDGMGRSQLENLREESPPVEKPWQHEG